MRIFVFIVFFKETKNIIKPNRGIQPRKKLESHGAIKSCKEYVAYFGLPKIYGDIKVKITLGEKI